MDDIEDAARLLDRMARALGYESAYVTDPRQAVAEARKFRPTIALVDIGMPHINGYDLAPQLRKALEPEQVWILAVTAWGSEKDRQYSLAAGFDGHLLKPVDTKVLENALKACLGR